MRTIYELFIFVTKKCFDGISKLEEIYFKNVLFLQPLHMVLIHWTIAGLLHIQKLVEIE